MDAAITCGNEGSMPWVYNPHAGGKAISPQVQTRIRARITAYAAKTCAGMRACARTRAHAACVRTYTRA